MGVIFHSASGVIFFAPSPTSTQSTRTIFFVRQAFQIPAKYERRQKEGEGRRGAGEGGERGGRVGGGEGRTGGWKEKKMKEKEKGKQED